VVPLLFLCIIKHEYNSWNMRQRKKIIKSHRKWLQLLLIAIVTGVIGSTLLFATHALTPVGDSEPESGTIATPAAAIGDISASGGSAIKFGAVLGVSVQNGQLVNAAGHPLRLLGVDISGTEDACIQNKGIAYSALNDAKAAALPTWHINAVRVPLNEDCWLGINGAPAAYSGVNYQTAITNWVNLLNSHGLLVILDLHWSAPGTTQATTQWQMADVDHSPTFWTQVATTFKTNPAVMFDLFNEPKLGGTNPTAANWNCWLSGCTTTYTSVTYDIAGMQSLVTAVRNSGATQPILVGSLDWAGDPCGTRDTDNTGGACRIVDNLPTDPLNKLAVSFHTYDWTACRNTTCWNTTKTAISAANLPLVATELGEADCQATYMNNFMNWADQNNASYLAWSWEVYTGGSSTCIGQSGGPINGSGMNLQYLSNFDGTPNTVAPQPANYKAHLMQLAQ